MRPEGLQVALRQRSPWEAADLGFVLVRRHAASIARSWLLFGLPLFALLNGIAYALDRVWLAALAMWWLKPWFDQLVLHILSRAAFADPPSVGDTLRQQFRLGAVLPWLLWRRVDLSRSLSMPVSLLENLRGRERRLRSTLLGRASNSAVAIALCLVLMHIELAVWMSVFMLALMFVPYDFLSESLQVMFETLLDDPPHWAQMLVNLVSFFAMSVVEPFFVGAGFALYLNRRTQLEAWDIELSFRRIARRIGALAFMLVVLPGIALITTPTALAAAANHAVVEPAAAIATDDDAPVEAADDEEWTAEVIESRALADVFADHRRDAGFARDVTKTLQAPEFGEKKTLQRWERIHPLTDSASTKDLWPFLRGIGAIIAFFAKFGLWILLALLIAAVLIHAAKWRLPMIERLLRRNLPGAIEIEADRPPESLPSDLIAAARTLFAQGAPRAAMALLYRGTCAALPLHADGMLTPGATESDVLRLACGIDDVEARTAVIDVVQQWQRSAYADDPPDAHRFEALIARYEHARRAAQ